jgi:hypothetical protein
MDTNHAYPVNTQGDTALLHSQIQSALDEYDYQLFGLRADVRRIPDGEEVPESYVYEDGVKGNELVGGVSAVAVGHGVSVARALATLKDYSALGRGWITLVGGDFGERGVDDGEVVIYAGIALTSWRIK